jgi:hypothetical protein|tara:strand:+ start:151 stop:372 length:222 start_codon:yes stop_codon:yes gene_type:complete
MSQILRDIIFEQNLDLLTKIANDKYNHPEDIQKFIQKYHKTNFTYMKVDKKEKDTIIKYTKLIQRRAVNKEKK